MSKFERLDNERFLNQGTWESDGINNIRDRNLAFHSWSYGIFGVQVDTAKIYFPLITGRELLDEYWLNILIAGMHMRWLLDNVADEDIRKAEMSYNAGGNGMKHGGGVTYPGCIDTTIQNYRKFKIEQYPALIARKTKGEKK